MYRKTRKEKKIRICLKGNHTVVVFERKDNGRHRKRKPMNTASIKNKKGQIDIFSLSLSLPFFFSSKRHNTLLILFRRSFPSEKHTSCFTGGF